MHFAQVGEQVDGTVGMGSILARPRPEPQSQPNQYRQSQPDQQKLPPAGQRGGNDFEESIPVVRHGQPLVGPKGLLRIIEDGQRTGNRPALGTIADAGRGDIGSAGHRVAQEITETSATTPGTGSRQTRLARRAPQSMKSRIFRTNGGKERTISRSPPIAAQRLVNFFPRPLVAVTEPKGWNIVASAVSSDRRKHSPPTTPG